MSPENLKHESPCYLPKNWQLTIPGIICHLQESHSEILGRSQGSRSRDQSLGPGPDRVPNCRQLPKAFSATSHAAIFAPGTAAGSLRAPEEDAPNRASSLFLPPGIQTPRTVLGSRTENGMLPPVSIAPSFFPEGPGNCSKFAPAGERPRAPSEKGGGGGRRQRAGRRRARERGVGDPEGEEQERAARALPFSTQRCHMRRVLRFLGLWRESRASGRAAAGGPHR